MGGCLTQATTKSRQQRGSKSAEAPAPMKAGAVARSGADTTESSSSQQHRGAKMHTLQSTKSSNAATKDVSSNKQGATSSKELTAPSKSPRKPERNSARGKSAGVPEANKEPGRQGAVEAETNQKMKNKPRKRQTFDISPRIVRQFRIYNISSKTPVHAPYSRETEWQQVLQLYAQKLNMSSFSSNIGGLNPASLKNKKQAEIQNHLEQIQMHREIELMVKLLNLRNRNWVQEQIKMSRRLANMQPGSFDSLVVTREHLQLKEHFNWLVWAVGFYYFQMSKIEQFFQYFQSVSSKNEGQTNNQNQRAKQQHLIQQEINHLVNQLKNLKTKLPSPISKKWTEGFTFQGVFFRMLPHSDSHFVRNEMKALKYMQTEVMELSQIQNQINDMSGQHSFSKNMHQQPQSIFKNLILPLLSAIECGGFLIFASPTIFIQDYDDDSAQYRADGNGDIQNQNGLFKEADDNTSASPGGRNTIKGQKHSLQKQSTYQEDQLLEMQQKQRARGQKRSLTGIYGHNVYQNHKNIANRKPIEYSTEKTFSFLQKNIGEIDDPLLKMMPLLKNITQENVIPLIDFEDTTQTDLNYLLLHVFDCIPSVGLSKAEQSTVMMRIPGDQNAEIRFINISDLTQVSVNDIKQCLKQKSKRKKFANHLNQNQKGSIDNPFSLDGKEKTSKQAFKNNGGFSDESSMHEESEFDSDFQEEEFDVEPTELFDAKCFTKHGHDILMISNNISNLLPLQNVQNTPSTVEKTKDTGGQGNSIAGLNAQSHDAPNLKNYQQNQNIIVNKRAQALFMSREEESNYDGLFKKNESNYIQSVIQFQASQIETLKEHAGGAINQIGTGGFVVGAGSTHKSYNTKKQSILRKNNNTGGFHSYNSGGISTYGSGNGVPGMTSIYGDSNDHHQGASAGEDFVVQGNAVIVAHNSSSEFKLKYPLINHAYTCSIEQIFSSTIEQVAKIIENTDTIQNIQSLKDLLHRKGLNLRFEWILLSKLKSGFHRELVMIHILLRTMKKIINEEIKLKAQVFTPNKAKVMNTAAPKSLADHQKQSKRSSLAGAKSEKQCDHFIGNHYENFKDNLVFFTNTLLRRKFSKQKHVFDETLIGLFLSRLKVFPIMNSIHDLGRSLNQRLIKESDINYIESKDILDDIISAPSSNPALYMNSIQTYFNVDIEQEFMRKCRQDKYLFLSQLNSNPMMLKNLTNVNLKCQSFFSLKEFAYFMLANQICKSQTEERNEQLRQSERVSQVDINQNIRSNIFRNQQNNNRGQKLGRNELNASMRSMRQEQIDEINSSSQNGRGNQLGPMGGAPGRRESNAAGQNVQVRTGNMQMQMNYQNANNDPLNSSSITDKKSNRFQNDQANSSVISRSSAFATQNLNRSSYQNVPPGMNAPGHGQKGKIEQTPRQFNNIDDLDTRKFVQPFNRGLERQNPQIQALNMDQLPDQKVEQKINRSELIIPAILYKLNTNCSTADHQEPARPSNPSQNHTTTSNLLSFYYMPNQHVFNTWVMYLESILKEVFSVEGSEQILLEALNFLALNIYFGETNGDNFFAMAGQSPLISPTSPLNIQKRDSLSSNRIGRADVIGNDFDRDQFMKVCVKIKEIQTFTYKCSPEVLSISQIICGLNYEQVQDDSIFPIEAEKSYLTALICLFQLIGDPRGRGNISTPYMLLITWKLSLLSLSTENRKVHDSEFSEELFDATLCNLMNHKIHFRTHQNEKLNRVIISQDKIDKQNLLSGLNKQSTIGNPTRKQNQAKDQASHRQGNNNLRDMMYRISSFEDEMDREHKKRNQFDIKRYRTRDSNKIRDSKEMFMASTPKGMQSSKQMLQASNVTYAGGFQNAQAASAAGNIGHNNGKNTNANVNQSYQGGGFLKMNEKNLWGHNAQTAAAQHQDMAKNSYSHVQGMQNRPQKDLNSLLEANISDIDLEFDDEESNQNIYDNGLGEAGNFLSTITEYVYKNFSGDSLSIPEVPFVHWSIYRQGIQNLLLQQGHKFSKNQKQLNKFLSQMYKNVLHTAIDKKILYPWLIKYNMIMYQSGQQWTNNQIKQAVFFQTAQMISSRSSSKSFQKNESEYSLSLSIQGSMISQGGQSYRQQSTKTQHLGAYSSIINTENGSINKGDIHGVVYSWGSDAQGQLGQDSFAHLTKKPVTQKILYPRIISVLKDEFIKEVCCGYSHTLAITIHGNVYSWGFNETCQLGLGPKAPEFVRKPVLIRDLKNIVKLSAGNEHSVAINKNQELYSWGSKSQTGQNDLQHRDTPSKMEYFKNHKIQQVSCGGLHTIALTKESKVYCWGSTEGGQLGLPTGVIQKLCRNEDNAVKQPQQLVSLQDQVVTQVACGETHSLCLCKNGSIFGWGMSLYGQLGLGFSSDSFEPGLGMEKSKVMEPRKIESLKDEQVAKIYCGSTFSLFLTKNGELYGCGMNDLGQLGEDIYNDLSVLENARMGQMQTSDITIPTQVSSLLGIQISTVACGESHVLAIDGDGKDRNMLWAWGQYKSGQLGLGEVNTKLNPRPVQNLSSGTVNKIACGSGHSLALIGDASNVTTLTPQYYAANEVLSNAWSTELLPGAPTK